jgi:hypothetical protein
MESAQAGSGGERQVTSDLSQHLAAAVTSERLRAGAERRRAESLADAVQGRANAPGRQRALVRLSLFHSRRGRLTTDERRA